MKRFLGVLLVAPLALASFAWGCAALWFDGPSPGLLTAGFAAISAALLGFVRPIRRGLAGFAGLLLIVILWWTSIEPSNERDWLPDVARTTSAVIDGSAAFHATRTMLCTSSTARWIALDYGPRRSFTCESPS